MLLFWSSLVLVGLSSAILDILDVLVSHVDLYMMHVSPAIPHRPWTQATLALVL